MKNVFQSTLLSVDDSDDNSDDDSDDDSDDEDKSLSRVLSCRVCLVNVPIILLLCGHVFCKYCSNRLVKCPFCKRKLILKTVNMFFS